MRLGAWGIVFQIDGSFRFGWARQNRVSVTTCSVNQGFEIPVMAIVKPLLSPMPWQSCPNVVFNVGRIFPTFVQHWNELWYKSLCLLHCSVKSKGGNSLFLNQALTAFWLSKCSGWDPRTDLLILELATIPSPWVPWCRGYKLPAWKVGNRGFEPYSDLQVSKKQNVSSPLTRNDLILLGTSVTER